MNHQTMHKIGVISDTHGVLREDVMDILRTCEAVLHAGDIHVPHVIERLKSAAPLYAACGLSVPPDKMKTIAQRVIKETDKGTSVENIARKCRIPEELAAQICRLYLTHPGIQADGILKKM